MKRNVITFTAVCLIFLLMLALSGATGGIISEAIYCLGFILPTIIGIFADKRVRKEESAHDREYKEPKALFKMNSGSVSLLLPLIFPTVVLIFSVSALSSALIGAAFGVQSHIDIGDGLPMALLSHALLPAIFEEMLFRFLPMKMLSRHSARLTVIISSLYFALVHNSFFSIPYALLAGVIFMTADLLCESLLPSVILHLCNNAVSVILMFFSADAKITIIIFVILIFLSLISVIFIIMMRARYVSGLKRLFSACDDFKLGLTPLALAVPTLFLAITELL